MSDEIVYRIDPELSCDFAPEQGFVPGDGPLQREAVRPLQLQFDTGAHGAFIRCTPYYGAVPELIEAWRAAGITGFTTLPMVCGPHPLAAQEDPQYHPPAYVEVVLEEDPAGGEADVWRVAGEGEVRVSRRAAQIYTQFDPGLGGLAVGTADDVYPDLPPGIEEQALRF